jgi:type IV fimbrial biogenesis protein FimT
MRKAPEMVFFESRERMAGVTLLELLVVIVVAAILMGVATSSYKSITLSSRISSEINGLLGDMQYARSEAIKQGQNVVICVAPATANDCVAGNTNWDQGWIVFVDPTGGKSTGGNAALILRRQVAFSTNSAGGTGDTLSDGLTSNVSFDREGVTLGLLSTMGGAGGAVVPLHTAPVDATKTRCLWITNVGNVSVQQPSTLATCT